jgi:hypothetical protein
MAVKYMSAFGDFVPIFRQVGEIAATQVGFKEDLNELKKSIDDLGKERRASSENVSLQNDQISKRIDNLERQGWTQHFSNTQRLDEMAKDIVALKEPVAQFVSLRQRVGIATMLLLSASGLIWTFFSPLYSALIGHWLGHS